MRRRYTMEVEIQYVGNGIESTADLANEMRQLERTIREGLKGRAKGEVFVSVVEARAEEA